MYFSDTNLSTDGSIPVGRVMKQFVLMRINCIDERDFCWKPFPLSKTHNKKILHYSHCFFSFAPFAYRLEISINGAGFGLYVSRSCPLTSGDCDAASLKENSLSRCASKTFSSISAKR